MGYIYSITNKINSKKYIGQSLEKDIHERWKSHFKKGSNCRYLKHALKKYGKENFKFDIICICFDSDCNKYEQEYMNKWGTLNNGYNLREAGNNGRHSEATKKKISDTLRLNYSKLSDSQKKQIIEKRTGINNHRFGKKMSQETKEKIIKSMKTKKRVNCYKMNGMEGIEFINTYESISDAAKATKSDSSYISRCCRGKVKTCNGFIWKFYEK